MHQDGNYRDIPLQSRGGFEAHEIGGIVEPALTGFIFRIQPSRPDHRQQDAARSHIVIDDFTKIEPRLDRGNIHENRAVPEPAAQIVIETARLALAVIPPVTDENRPHARQLVRPRILERRALGQSGEINWEISPEHRLMLLKIQSAPH